MNSIGERLRQERLRRGFDLNQIAELTKISPMMLEAIEADDLDRLPGSFFARSFVRQYAQALGLDEDEFEAELRRVAGFGHPATDQAEAEATGIPSGPVPAPAARRRPNRHVFGSLMAFLVILGVCTGISALWQRTHSMAAKSPQVAVATPSPTPLPTATASPTPTPEAAAPTATPVETPAPPAATATPETAVAAPAPELAEATPRAAVVPAGAIRLELRATSEAWVRVVGDGKTLYSGVLQPNEARVFKGTDSITLRAGNAGALAATFNGKPMGELGPEGQARTIQFTPAGFKYVMPAPAAEPVSDQQ